MPRVHKTNARIAAGDPLAAWPIPQVPRFLHYSGGPAKGRLRSGAPTEGADKEASQSFLKGPLPPSGHRIERRTIDLQSDINCLPERSLLGAFGKQHDDYDHDVFNSAGSTLATPHFGPENGVHLTPHSDIGTVVQVEARELSFLFTHPRALLLIFLACARQYPRHDLVASALPRLDVQNTPLAGARESRSSATDRRAPTLGETATALESGPWPLGALAQILDRLGEGPRDRQTRHRSALAPCRLPTLLDVEESATAAGSPMRCPGGSRADPQHVPGQPTLGSAARARRASQARHLHFSGRCFQVHDSPSQATVPDLAELSRQSCRGLGVHRLLHVADRHLPDSCSFSSFSVTIAGASSISMSRSILRQSEPRSRSLMLFRGIRRRVTCCETGMESTGRTSNGALRDSTSSRFRRRRAPRGRAPTSNGSLEAFGASVSIT